MFESGASFLLRTEATERGGKLILSLNGPEDGIRGAVAFLEENKVQVGEVSRSVVQDEGRYTNCSMCVSICPVRAYQLDERSWKVAFDQDRRIACGLCVDACPGPEVRGPLHPNDMIKPNMTAGTVSSSRPCRSSPSFRWGPVPAG